MVRLLHSQLCVFATLLMLSLVSVYAIAQPEIYSITQVGAVGDGTTDDTTSIQDTINIANAFGGSVYIPPGEFRITAAIQVPTGMKIFGGSRRKSVIMLDSSTANAFEVNGAMIEFSSFTIDRSQTATAGSGISLQVGTAWYSVFRDLLIKNHFDGIDTMNAANTAFGNTVFDNVASESNQRYGWNLERARGTFQNCFAAKNGSDGFHFSNSSGSPVAGIEIYGGTSWNNNGMGIRVVNSSLTNAISDIIISGFNLSFNNNHGLALENYGHNFQITNVFTEYAGTPLVILPGWVASNVGDGLNIGPNATDVSIVNLNSYLNAHCGAEVTGNSSRISFSGSQLHRNGRAALSGEQFGLKINQSTNISVTGSQFYDESAPGAQYQNHGISYNGSSDFLVITGNSFRGNAVGGVVGSPGVNSVVANNLL